MVNSNDEYRRIHEHINDGLDLEKVNMSHFNKEQQDHLLMHKKHFGHEGMHAAMFFILIGAIAVTQVALIAWKRRHYKSYQNVSMFCMWLVPLGIAVYNHWIRFISIWTLITLLTCALISRPLLKRNMHGSTPRLVYKWFFWLYSISSVVAVSGYVIIMCVFFGINMMLGIKPNVPLDIGFLLLFYGIYYGVLTRDFTDFLVDLLAANIGFYQPSSALPNKQLNSNLCAICGRSHLGIPDKLDSNFDTCSSSAEKVFTLSCGHKYHEYCIYGWCLIGKKQVCPFCREKVDTGKLFASLPFQKPHYLYGNLLDFIRYLVAWQPLIIFAVQFINHTLGLE